MLGRIYNLYALLFAKPLFSKMNKFLYNLSIRGLGILNYKTKKLRGESYWLKSYLSNLSSPFTVDVGANIGAYTLVFANLVGSQGAVTALEADYQALCEHRHE